jgi:hypothetical protein
VGCNAAEEADPVDGLTPPVVPPPIDVAPFLPPGTPGLIARPRGSTALEADEPEGTIPNAALWVMKYRRHLRLGFGGRENERVRTMIGDRDATAYVIDDGPRHFMVARQVGKDPEGLTYCLVGRIDAAVLDRYANLGPPPEEVFSEARDLALCSVFTATQGVSNVMLVETYRHVDDVPPEYLPPAPFIEFD